MKTTRITLTILALVALALFSTSPAPAQGPIKIGLVQGISGALEVYLTPRDDMSVLVVKCIA